MQQIRMLAMLLAMMSITHVHGQQLYWETTGNTVNNGEWFGAVAGSTDPLQIRHDAGNQPVKPLQGLLKGTLHHS